MNIIRESFRKFNAEGLLKITGPARVVNLQGVGSPRFEVDTQVDLTFETVRVSMTGCVKGGEGQRA